MATIPTPQMAVNNNRAEKSTVPAMGMLDRATKSQEKTVSAYPMQPLSVILRVVTKPARLSCLAWISLSPIHHFLMFVTIAFFQLIPSGRTICPLNFSPVTGFEMYDERTSPIPSTLNQLL